MKKDLKEDLEEDSESEEETNIYHLQQRIEVLERKLDVNRF